MSYAPRVIILGLLTAASAFFTVRGAESAEITVSQRLLGGTMVHISGMINRGDQEVFATKTAAIADPANTVVWLTSPGGSLAAAFAIARTVRDRGYSTMVNRFGGCASACPLIWFSGRHAVIQRNSLLVFHMAYDARTGQASPEAISETIAYLRTVGLTESQARFLANAAVPSDGWVATEASAYALGFRPQVIPTPMAMRSCQSKFCLTIP